MNVSIIKGVAKIFFTLIVVGIICTGGVSVIQSLIEKGTAPGPKTLEVITGVNLDDVDKIETTKTFNGSYNVEEFRNSYRGQLFTPFSDELTLKKADTYKLYDSNGTLLMTLKDYSRDSVIELDVGGEISLYKRYTPEES